MGKLNDIAER